MTFPYLRFHDRHTFFISVHPVAVSRVLKFDLAGYYFAEFALQDGV